MKTLEELWEDLSPYSRLGASGPRAELRPRVCKARGVNTAWEEWQLGIELLVANL